MPPASAPGAVPVGRDIVSGPGAGIPKARILGAASNADEAALRGLLDVLNQTRTIFPGTRLRTVYELPANRAAAGEPAS